MKRIIALLLVTALCITTVPATVFAAEPQFVYTDGDIEDLYDNFEYLSGMVESLFYNDEGLAYWKYAGDMADKKTASWLIDKANTILGEKPDKKYYTQVLVNMIAMFEYDMAQQIETQGQYDNMKNIAGYGFDLLDIGATVVGLEDAGETIGKVISAVSDGIQLAFDSANEIKYYELAIQNYAKAENFLRAVNEYSDNKTLGEAAHELRTVNRLMFKERARCIANIADKTVLFTAKNFLSDFSFAILRNIDEYKTDSVVKDYVDYGEKAYKALDRLVATGKAVFKTVMMGGDLLFGTTNTFRRHNEMMTMADIAEALIAANNDIKVSKNASPQSVYSNIRTKCEYYKMLLATHLHGEYLIYSLNYNDAGVLSQITKWIDKYSQSKSQTIQSWYDGQANYCEEYYDKVNDLFARLIQQKYVVHNGFELHDGFIIEIEQLDTVPEGYIGVYAFDDFKQIADSCPSDAYITSGEPQKTEFNTAKYILMNDIVCPADYDTAGAFYGILNGNGYTMQNLNKPLFRYVGNAIIKNIGFEINYTVDTEDKEFYFGTIAHAANGFNNKNGVYINNCFVKGNIDITCRSGAFGGFIGTGKEVNITNCYNEANIAVKTRQSGILGGICGDDAFVANCFNTGSISMYTTCARTLNAETVAVEVGGIKGHNYSISIRNCYNTGEISATSPFGCHVYSGGILGYNFGSSYSTYIENCYNTGKVIGEWADTYDTTKEYGGVFTACYSSGGIVGFSGYNLHLNKCWNSGIVSGEHFVGGIIGSGALEKKDSITNCYNAGSVSAVQYAGGILGMDMQSTGIVNSYNAGVISGTLYAGSIAGTIQNGDENLVSCYYIDNGVSPTSAGINYSGVRMLTVSQMADINSFEGFDFVETWKLRESDTMPRLKQ